MTTKTAIAATSNLGFATLVTLTDGRSLIARNVGDRWTGALVLVTWFDPTTLVVGEYISRHAGTSHRIAIDKALATLVAA